MIGPAARAGSTSVGQVETELAEFELDLCTDVVGVVCPLAVGDTFSGIVTWNGEIPQRTKRYITGSDEIDAGHRPVSCVSYHVLTPRPLKAQALQCDHDPVLLALFWCYTAVLLYTCHT